MSISTHLLGAIGTLSFSLLPGVALITRRFGGSPLERLGLMCAVSLSVNCFALMVLNLLGVYRVSTAWLWLAVVLAGSLAVVRARRAAGAASGDSDRPPAGTFLDDALALPLVLLVLVKTSFYPFGSWDAIASWNRWARAYFVLPDYFHREIYLYPQYHSWAMSFPYMLMGDATFEYYSHAFSVAYLLVLYAGVARISRRLGAPGWLAFCLLFVTSPIAAWVGSGYADDGAAAFSTLAIGIFLDAFDAQRHETALRRALGAGLLGGTALLFKPSTIAVLVPILGLSVLLLRKGRLQDRALLACVAFAGALLLVSTWLVSAQTAANDGQLGVVTKGIHGAISRFEILRRGLDTLLPNTTYTSSVATDRITFALACALAGVAMLGNRAALCVGLAALTGLVLWINTVNYDMRGLLPAVTLAGLLAAAGLFRVLTAAVGAAAARVASVGVAVGAIALFFVAELDSSGALITRDGFDTRPADQWSRVGLLADQREKASALLPAIGALLDWKAAHPDFSSHFWSDSLLSAAFDPRLPNGGGRWVGLLFGEDGRPLWEIGDVLLLADDARGESIRPRWIRGGGHVFVTWDDWLRSLEARGIVRATGRWRGYSSYEVLKVETEPAFPPSA